MSIFVCNGIGRITVLLLCYAAVRSHGLAHILHAMLQCRLYILMHWHTHVMLYRCTFACACTRTSCYLLYVLMHLHTYGMLRCCTFACTGTHTFWYAAVRSHALAHIRHATLVYVFTHLHTYVLIGRCTCVCTCTRTSCYAAVRSPARAHILR